MEDVEAWQALGIICGSLIAAGTLINWAWRKVIRPMWTAGVRTVRRLNLLADDLLGDPEHGVPSLTERISALEASLEEHLRWHSATGRANGPKPAPRDRRR